jgi:hypothetical protein
MPRDPKTGAFIDQATFDAIVAEEGHPESGGADRVHQHYGDRPQASPLTVILLVAMLAMGAFLAWKQFRPSTPTGPAPIVIPSGNLDSLVAPIRQKLAYDPAKAAKVFRAYSGFRDALAGPSGQRVIDTRVFAAVTAALLTDIDAGGGTPIGRDIDQAVAAHLGITWGRDKPGEPEGWEFRKFTPADVGRLVEITGAIAVAAEAGL